MRENKHVNWLLVFANVYVYVPRVEWSGVEWSGVEWSGVEWSGVQWSRVTYARRGLWYGQGRG